jgi:hypothetical protein
VKPDNKPDNRSFPLTKHSKAYWLAKVYRPRVRGGEVDNYAVRLHHAGIQRNLSLGTPNRDLAAGRARDWFVYLSANGWTAFLAKYREPANPASSSPESALRTDLTIGEYLTAVRTESELAHKTIDDYEGRLRLIVSEIMEMRKGGSRRQYDHYRGGHKEWLAAVDAVPLESITPGGESASEACRQQLTTYRNFRMHVARNPKYQRRLRQAEEVREHFLREYHIANITKHAVKNVAASVFWLERRYPNEFALKAVNRDSGDMEKQALCGKISLEQLVANAELAAEIAANPPPGLVNSTPLEATDP